MAVSWALEDLIWLGVGVTGFTAYRLEFPLLVCVGLALLYGTLLRALTSASVRGSILGLVDLIVYIFFREVSSRGEHLIPKEGPLIFVCAPHSNQFLDPAIVLHQSTRSDLGFVIAAKSFNRRVIGPLARGMDSIPVVRPQDAAKPAPGMIRVSEDNPSVVHGAGTAFERHVKARHTVYVAGAGAAVAEVVSDTELRLKEPLEKPVPKWTAYKVAPHVEHATMFEAAWDRLRSGKCVGVFPEGGSHDRASLLPLKAGVSIMALGAMARHPSLRVRIVPCGLTYFNGHRFRSRAYVHFGDPMDVNQDYVKQFAAGGSAKRAVCNTLLADIRAALESVTVNAPDHKTLELVWTVQRLHKPTGMRLSPAQRSELTQLFLRGYEAMRDDPRLHRLDERVAQYNALLRAHGLKDYQVESTSLNSARALALLAFRIAKLVGFGSIAVPGLVLNLPVIIISRYISARKQAEALRSSNVKVAARDVLASWKVIIALVLVPLMYVLGLFLSGLGAVAAGWRVSHTVVYSALAIPIVSYASIRVMETELRIWTSLHPLVLSIVRRTRGSKLRNLRRSLQKEVRMLVQTMGPQVFEDWETRNVGYTWPESAPASASHGYATAPASQHSVDTAGLRARR